MVGVGFRVFAGVFVLCGSVAAVAADIEVGGEMLAATCELNIGSGADVPFRYANTRDFDSAGASVVGDEFVLEVGIGCHSGTYLSLISANQKDAFFGFDDASGDGPGDHLAIAIARDGHDVIPRGLLKLERDSAITFTPRMIRHSAGPLKAGDFTATVTAHYSAP